MREYDDYGDDSIRLYTPILQLVIILAAVVITVPVLMWTITTFVRSYVARPKVPLVEHVASTNAPMRVPLVAAPPDLSPSGPAPSPAASPAPSLASSAADQTASPGGEGAAGDTPNQPGETKRAALNLAVVPNANSPNAAIVASAASVQATPVSVSSPAAAASDAVTASPAAATTASVPRLPQAPRATDSTASAASDRGIAWPNPNATSPPDFTAPRLAPSPPAAPALRTATAEVLPPDEPLRGPVPLPRHRPSIVAMAATLVATRAATVAAVGPVPLPRARPGDVPATSDTVVELPASGRLELENAH
jgi:hypothetical protein